MVVVVVVVVVVVTRFESIGDDEGIVRGVCVVRCVIESTNALRRGVRMRSERSTVRREVGVAVADEV